LFEGYLKVASPLAAQLGEILDGEIVRANPRLKELMSGWWANRFGLLGVLRETIEKHAPETARILSNARAFHEVIPWKELWSRFPVLGSPPEPTEPSAEKESLVLGLTSTQAAFERELAKGSGSKVGEKIKEFTVDALDFSIFRE